MTISDLKPLEARFFGNKGTVTFFSICDFTDAVYGPKWYEQNTYSYAHLMEKLNTFLKENPDVNYYCAPREDFYLGTAQDETLAKGKHYCIVEDLS